MSSRRFLNAGDRSTVWIIVVAFVMLFMSAALGLVFFRRRKFERDLELMLWKVNYSDIVFMKGNRLSEEGDPVARVVGSLMLVCISEAA